MTRPGLLRPDTLGLTIVLAFLTGLGPLSTDMYLPSLPAMARDLAVSDPQVQWTLSSYLFGFAAGQIFYGPVADKYGRKPAILFGLGLYTLASAVCAVATSVEMLIAARFLQALGAAGAVVLVRAIVRDLYEGERAGRELLRIGMIMGVVPAVAPVLGGLLEIGFGWRANFWLALLLAGSLLTVVGLLLPETVREKRPEPLSFKAVFASFRVCLASPIYRLYVLLASLSYGGLFAFICGSPFVLQKIYGLDPVAFGFSFAFGVLGFITGTIVAQRLGRRLTVDQSIRVGAFLMAGSGLTMVLLVGVGTGYSFEISASMAVYAAGMGIVLPQANASAIMPFPERAGAASSLQGLTQMSFAAIVGALLVPWLKSSALPLAVTVAIMGVMTVLAIQEIKRQKAMSVPAPLPSPAE